MITRSGTSGNKLQDKNQGDLLRETNETKPKNVIKKVVKLVSKNNNNNSNNNFKMWLRERKPLNNNKSKVSRKTKKSTTHIPIYKQIKFNKEDDEVDDNDEIYNFNEITMDNSDFDWEMDNKAIAEKFKKKINLKSTKKRTVVKNKNKEKRLIENNPKPDKQTNIKPIVNIIQSPDVEARIIDNRKTKPEKQNKLEVIVNIIRSPELEALLINTKTNNLQGKQVKLLNNNNPSKEKLIIDEDYEVELFDDNHSSEDVNTDVDISEHFGFDNNNVAYNNTAITTNTWRLELPLVRNPHLFRYKTNFLPNQDQELIIDHTITEKLENWRRTDVNSTNKEINLVQTTLNDFVENCRDNEDVTNEQNITLFDENNFSPVKASTPFITTLNRLRTKTTQNLFQRCNILKENQEINLISSNIENDKKRNSSNSKKNKSKENFSGNKENSVKTKSNLSEILGNSNKNPIDKNELSTENAEIAIENTEIFTKNTDISMVNEQNSLIDKMHTLPDKPFRCNIKVYERKRKKHEVSLQNEEYVAEEMPEDNANHTVIEENSLDDLDKLKFFHDLEESALFVPKRKHRASKRKHGSPNKSDEFGEHISKRKRKALEKEDKEMEKWAKEMNAKFAEIDDHHLEYV